MVIGALVQLDVDQESHLLLHQLYTLLGKDAEAKTSGRLRIIH